MAATYSYDRRNRIASWERGGQEEHFGYDTLGNLIRYATPGENEINQQFAGTRPHAITSSTASGATISYTHDADGNLATALGGTEDRYYQFDWANRLTGVGTTAAASDVLAVLYDARGGRVTDVRGAQQRVYAGDHFTVHRDGPLSPFELAEFHIFAFGEMVGYKRQNPVTLRSASTGAWLPSWRAPPWLGWVALTISCLLLLAMAARSGALEAAAKRPALAGWACVLAALLVVPPVPAGGGGGGGSTSRRWLVTDHIGNGTVWLDSGGERVRHTEFAPFGRVYPGAQVASGAVAAPGIYAGHRREIASGLDYMQARWYDSATGTFLSVDPLVADVEDPQSHNAYSYARNNPILFTDPTGEIFSPFFNALVGFAFLPAIAGFGSEPGFIGGSLVPGAAGSSILSNVLSSPSGPIQDSDENVIFPSERGRVGDRDQSSGLLVIFGEAELSNEPAQIAGAPALCIAAPQVCIGTIVKAGAIAAGASSAIFGGLRVLQKSGEDAEALDGALADLESGGNVEESGELRNVDKTESGEGANDAFDRLAESLGRKPTESKDGKVRVVELPGGGTASVRPTSKTGPATVQVNRPGSPTTKVRFPRF